MNLPLISSLSLTRSNSPPEYYLSRGNHLTRETGTCVMEYVAFVAGERHTARPECVDPYLVNVMWAINDHLNDVERQKLKRYVDRLIGTATDGLTQTRQDTMRRKGYACGCGCSALSGRLVQVSPSEQFALLDALLPTAPLTIPPAPAIDVVTNPCTDCMNMNTVGLTFMTFSDAKLVEKVEVLA